MYPLLEKFITSAPVVAMAVEGIHAVELVRKVVGSTEPKTAPIGTIREIMRMSHMIMLTRSR